MNLKTSTINAIQIIIGILAIIFGIVLCFSHEWAFRSLERTSFGGDFYTYMYDVTRKIYSEINQTNKLLESLSNYFGYLLVFLGANNILKGCRNSILDEQNANFQEQQIKILLEIANSSNCNKNDETSSLIGAKKQSITTNSPISNSAEEPLSYLGSRSQSATNTNGIRRRVTCSHCGLEQPFGSTRCTSCSQLLK